MPAATPIVHVITSDPKTPTLSTVRPVAVQLGTAAAGFFEVKGDLKANDQVVIQGERTASPELTRYRHGEEVIAANLNIHRKRKRFAGRSSAFNGQHFL